MTASPWFVGAVVGTIVTTTVLVLMRLLGRASGLLGPEEALPALVASAALLVVGLTWRRAPTIAWLAVIGAGMVSTIDMAVAARALRDVVDASTWRWLTVVIGLAALWTSGAAVAYAAEPGRRLGRWVVVAGALGIVVVAGATGWAVALAAPAATLGASSHGSTRAVTRSFLVVTTLAVALGLLGDAREPLTRARRRVTAAGVDQGGDRLALARAFVEEIAPGRRRARQAALAERARIARDLHAEVVPGLRRAVALADGGGDLDALADQLRRTLTDVEALGAAEHPIELEAGGFLPAVEALAERVEATSDVTVSIDVADGPGPNDGEPPVDVAVAALRVVRLALDNVARHAPGAGALLTVEGGRETVHVVVTDDGPGLPKDARATAARAGHRGLADMATEAAAVGAALEVERVGPDGGTRVRFGWRSSRPA